MRALLVLLVMVCALPIARADTRAEAVALFDQGIKEMKAGNYEKACKSFAQSHELVADTGTKGSLAKCYEKLGRLATSWLLWRELADMAPTEDLRKDAAKQAAKLDPRVPKYVLKLTSPAAAGMVVSINGKTVDLKIDIPVPVDPGPIVATASAPGRQDWKADTTAAEGGTLVIEVPVLAEFQSDKPPPPPPPHDDLAQRRHKRHLIAGTMIGLGGAALVVGGAFGVIARGKFNDAKTTCGGAIDQCAPNQIAAAQLQVDESRDKAKLSSIFFAAGGAIVVTGIVVWITAPHAEKAGVAIIPSVAPDSAGFVVSGRF